MQSITPCDLEFLNATITNLGTLNAWQEPCQKCHQCTRRLQSGGYPKGAIHCPCGHSVGMIVASLESYCPLADRSPVWHLVSWSANEILYCLKFTAAAFMLKMLWHLRLRLRLHQTSEPAVPKQTGITRKANPLWHVALLNLDKTQARQKGACKVRRA